MADNFRFNKYFSAPVTLNIYAWLALSFLIFWVINPGNQNMEFKVILLASLSIFSSVPYFVTNYWLIPKFLYTKKFYALVILTVISIIVCALICMYGTMYSMTYYIPYEELMPSSEYVIYYFHIYFWNALLGTFSAGAVALYFSKNNIENLFASVQSEKIQAELLFLRGQINPHFLISVMDTLQDNLNEEGIKVQESVSTFKNLLNYQLFECNNDEINIEKEIEYLASYIKVQSNRMEVGSDIQLNTTGALTNFKIAPLMILPLIENAFKHVSHFNDPYRNKIYIDIYRDKPTELLIKVANTYEDNKGSKHLVKTGGIGLVNLKRRLELLYTNTHVFTTKSLNGFFTAELLLIID